MNGDTQEQALTAVHRVLPRLHADRDVARVDVGEHEGVQDFAGRTLRVTLGVRAQHAGDRQAVHQHVRGGIVLVVEVRIGVVIPARSTHPGAVAALPHHVELRQHVEPVGHERAVAEIAIAVVEVGAGEQVGVLRLRAYAQVVANGVVPADREILIAGVDVEGARRVHRE